MDAEKIGADGVIVIDTQNNLKTLILGSSDDKRNHTIPTIYLYMGNDKGKFIDLLNADSELIFMVSETEIDFRQFIEMAHPFTTMTSSNITTDDTIINSS